MEPCILHKYTAQARGGMEDAQLISKLAIEGVRLEVDTSGAAAGSMLTASGRAASFAGCVRDGKLFDLAWVSPAQWAPKKPGKARATSPQRWTAASFELLVSRHEMVECTLRIVKALGIIVEETTWKRQ